MKTNISSAYLWKTIRRFDLESAINLTKDVCKIYNNFPQDTGMVNPFRRSATGEGRFDKSALHDAAFWGYFEVCKLIIDNVDDANQNNGHWYTTPLHLAAQNNHLLICQLFMENDKVFDSTLGHSTYFSIITIST